MSLEQAYRRSPTARDRAAPSAARLDDPAFEQVRQLSSLLGLPLTACDARTGVPLAATGDEAELLANVPDDLLVASRESSEPQLLVTSGGLTYFGIPLAAPDDAALIAVGCVLTRQGLRPTDLVVAAADRGWSGTQFDEWLARQRSCDPELLERLLRMAVDELARTGRNVSIADDARIAQQLEYAYEELNLLHTLTQSMHLSQSPREITELSLQRINAVIRSEGHAIWLDDKRDGRMFLIEGAIPVDELGMARLIARFDGHDWPRPLVRNHVASTLLGADFPGLRNFALVPVADGGLRFGWILSCNLDDGADFGSVQTSLLSSVASILGTHQHNLELYRRHENLLLCFVRSLVSTLDAKDAYTRGHSERVALVARKLGAHLGLPEADLRDIYLAGLLHDIGKIGVDDQILRKTGQLTREEFEQIKRHPVIGYGILAGLRNLHPVLPGVRHHHEAYSGMGYPDGLKGEEIPLMARIIAVADSYDAMSSDRPYRGGLGLDKLELILHEGAGIQWDPRVVTAYFALRDEIRVICDSYSPAGGNLLGTGSCEFDALSEKRDPLRAIEGIRGALERVART
jgi:HD-GYP domain-containing protein (c-di-GMP phosphodiesterase class II)